MKVEKRQHSINRFFRFVNIFPIIFFVLFIAVNSFFTINYVLGHGRIFIILLISFSFVMLGVYIIFALYCYRRFQMVFVRGLYSTTVFNLKNIVDNDNPLIEYPNHNYDEFITLNDQIKSLKHDLTNSTLITNATDFTHLNLEFYDVSKNAVYYKSFKKELDGIIFASQNYRNVIIELYYDLIDDTLTQKEINYLLDLLKHNFNDYRQLMFVVAENHKSLYMYLPRIDSLSKIREQLELTIKSTSISKRGADGLANLSAHFSLVCYPFSDVKELLPDLEYAKRQGEIINIYLPNRLNSLKYTNILKNSMNLNTMSKILSPLLNLNLSLENSEKNRKEVEKVIKAIRELFDLDYAGIISYDEVKHAYYFSYQNQDKENQPLASDNYIEKEFVYAMNAAKDEDDSYYFSHRSHANSALGRHLDRVGLDSGLFYVLNEGDLTLGAIYFFNRHKEFHIDSYIQESLVVLCDKIATILLGEKRDEEVSNSYEEIDSLLKLSDFSTYRVAHDSHMLLRTSKTMSDIFPNLEIGEKCYKTLYGLDKPCRDCPLLTGNKKVTRINNSRYETSLVLANLKSAYQVMTMKNIREEEGEQRYNPDLLINSYSSLVEAMNNCYLINGKGYLLLLKIDNLNELIEKKGPEGYLAIMREFISRIKKRHNSLENIYFFNNQTLALLFTEYGQIDIVNECEGIYELSQKKKNEAEQDYRISLTYLPIGYPRAYPNALSVLKQAEQFANRGKYEINKNFIYFDDSSYARSASRDEFMLSVIDSSFGNNTYNINLQPMVDPRTKHIYGAELLLRIADDYRKIVFRADELVKVAAEHDKIGVISHSLLDYIASLYRQYAALIFLPSGFKRLSLNTDYSFFTDKNFYSDTKTYLDNLKTPKNFLAFEIPESDISSHYNEFRNITKQLRELHIVSVCDQYTGRFLSVEALKNVGFDEVKISRNIVIHIDSDRQRLNDVKNLLHSVRDAGMKASVVGVENLDQYRLLKEIDDTCLMQGFYFHRPLEKQVLVETIRGANISSRKDED